MSGTTLISNSKQTIQFVDGLCVTRTHERFTVGAMDSAIARAMQAPRLAGFYDVIVHGSYDGMHFVVKYAHQSSKTLHDANQLVRLIQAQPDYQPNQPVRLLICWAGKLEHGLAAQVAAQLNCAVLTATKEIVVGQSDEPPFRLFEGEWRLFQPTGGSHPFDC